MENNRIQILYIEDNKIDQMAFCDMVKTEELPYDYELAGSIKEAKELLSSKTYDVIFSDFLLGDGTAFDILDLKLEIPTIIATSAGNPTVAVKLMKNGASDYLLKDITRDHLKVLPITIETVLKNKKIAEQLKLLSMVASETDNSVVISDKAGKIEWVNDGFTRLTGYALKEVKGANADIYRNVEFTPGSPIYETLIIQKKPFTYQAKKQSKSNIPYWAKSYLTPVLNNTGEVEKLISIDVDITDLKRIQQQLTKSLTKERELNELKSRFVSMASHEFRTPLATILSSAALIKEYNKPEQEENRLKHINRIFSSIKNLTDILNAFLSLGKLEEGKVYTNVEAFDIVDLLSEITEGIQMTAKTGQKILYVHKGDAMEVSLDKNIMQNIINNLLNNAVKYSPENKPIELTTDIVNSEILISVKDYGIGIPDKDKPYMFERFFRAHNAVNIQGTGLGLSIVKRYIDLMDGTIDFTSELNKGTIFTVKIPLVENHGKQNATLANSR